MRMIILGLAAIASAALLLLISAQPVRAHQPYFEGEDLTAEAPWAITDPTISTALYATLEASGDVDYYAFDGQAGQAILVGMSIPQIDGQAAFNPAVAVIGPGLPAASLSVQLAAPDSAGVVALTDARTEAPGSFEPFSRTSYWQRQREYVTLPQDGRYVVAVWHEDGVAGRYTLVIGDREVPGGDWAFARKLRDYWQPVVPTPVALDEVAPGHGCAAR